MHINIGFLKLNIGGRYCVAKGFRFLWQVHFSFRADFVLLKFFFWNGSYPLFAFSRRRVVSSSLTAFRFQKSFFSTPGGSRNEGMYIYIFYFLNLKSFFNFELFLYQRIPQKKISLIFSWGYLLSGSNVLPFLTGQICFILRYYFCFRTWDKFFLFPNSVSWSVLVKISLFLLSEEYLLHKFIIYLRKELNNWLVFKLNHLIIDSTGNSKSNSNADSSVLYSARHTPHATRHTPHATRHIDGESDCSLVERWTKEYLIFALAWP